MLTRYFENRKHIGAAYVSGQMSCSQIIIKAKNKIHNEPEECLGRIKDRIDWGELFLH